ADRILRQRRPGAGARRLRGLHLHRIEPWRDRLPERPAQRRRERLHRKQPLLQRVPGHRRARAAASDQLRPPLRRARLRGPGGGGATALEETLGLPLPMAMAQWATALLLSNEPGSPYSFSGSPWSPLHDRLSHLETRGPGTVTLRHDGLGAVTSGAGLGGPA